jgi:hypothetical protein
MLPLVLCAAVALAAAEAPPRVIGVKTYKLDRPLDGVFREWRALGINTVFASVELNRTAEFRRLATENGIKRFVILPVFYDPDALKADPGLHAVTARGERAVDDWVTFACPSREDFRKRKIASILDLVREADPDGLSLDFIRHFVFWEMVYPDRKPESLPRTCFDDHCRRRFEKDTGIRVPQRLQRPADVAGWIDSHHRERFTQWRSDLITSFVAETVTEARRIKPGIRINLHAVPWRRTDFEGAIRTVAGQDFPALSAHLDFLSPMTYAHMVKREPSWVHAVVEDLAAQSRAPILPSIQVEKTYLETPLSAAEFAESLREALRPPSAGVVFWSWEALERAPEKKALIPTVLSPR